MAGVRDRIVDAITDAYEGDARIHHLAAALKKLPG
jgi:hypothetical protein